MRPPKSAKSQTDKVEIEPGAEKRLADILNKALNTPPKHVPDKRTKAAKGNKNR